MITSHGIRTVVCSSMLFASVANLVFAAEPPENVKRWLISQSWQRDTEGPVLSLGSTGDFDDTHMFAPAVTFEDGKYRLFYCGSQGEVSRRVFSLGLAESKDGRSFTKHPENPIFVFGDDKHSILTPTLLRSISGQPIRENGKLRMWFSSTDFQDASGMHTLHQSTSTDGLQWAPPSKPQLDHIYAPSVLRVDDEYRMWYVDVQKSPWIIKHASSPDGQNWTISSDPCLVIDQAWERDRLFYPTVLKADDVYLMWYGSYWRERSSSTATGFAVSQDGVHWHKHPDNPVLRPDPTRNWESHYVTSQSVIQLSNNSFRIWYASRKQPPFVNKYFAINTAIWHVER